MFGPWGDTFTPGSFHLVPQQAQGQGAGVARAIDRTVATAALVAIAALGALVGGEVQAMFARMTDGELFERSELIVTGTLIGSTRLKSGGLDQLVGVIKVDETLKGPPATVALIELPTPGRPVSSSDLRFDVGQSGLWYLRLANAGEVGLFAADHPQRFVAAADSRAAVDALRKRRGRQ